MIKRPKNPKTLRSKFQKLNEDECLKQDINGLLTRIKSQIQKIVFETDNTEFVIKEYCLEVKRQLQLSKEIRIFNIENQFEDFIEKVEIYEKSLLTNDLEKDNIKKKLKDLKKKLMWTNNDTFIYNNKLLETLQESYSYLTLESDDLINRIFNMKKMKYIEQYHNNPLGELLDKAVKVLDMRDHFDKIIRGIGRLLEDIVIRHIALLDNDNLLYFTTINSNCHS